MDEILEMITEINEDATTPKNVRERLVSIGTLLQKEGDNSMKVNQALYELDELANDNNIEQFTRTQLWNIVSMLENL